MNNWFFIGGHHQRTSKPNPITTTKKGKKTFKELPKPKPHPLVAISDIVQSKIESISNLTPTKFKLIIPKGGAIINEQKTIREKEKHQRDILREREREGANQDKDQLQTILEKSPLTHFVTIYRTIYAYYLNKSHDSFKNHMTKIICG